MLACCCSWHAVAASQRGTVALVIIIWEELDELVEIVWAATACRTQGPSGKVAPCAMRTVEVAAAGAQRWVALAEAVEAYCAAREHQAGGWERRGRYGLLSVLACQITTRLLVV